LGWVQRSPVRAAHIIKALEFTLAKTFNVSLNCSRISTLTHQGLIDDITGQFEELDEFVQGANLEEKLYEG